VENEDRAVEERGGGGCAQCQLLSFVPGLKGLMEGFIVMSFLYYYFRSMIYRQMRSCMERNRQVWGSDGMIGMILLFL